jgi:hypothetical protein
MNATATEGWRQVRAGVSLIVWSRLAVFDKNSGLLRAADETDFESGEEGHRALGAEYGRLICWLSFSVGTEYLTKGVCLLKGELSTKPVTVVRPPDWNEEVAVWVQRVNANDPSAKAEDTSFGTFKDAQVRTITGLGNKRALVEAALKLLASTIRNRDAHRYQPNVRAGHFLAVPRVFVPAFNALLQCLDLSARKEHLSHLSGDA